MAVAMEQMEVMGVRYHNVTVPEALDLVMDVLADGERIDIFFLNAEGVRRAQKDLEYRAIINEARFVLSDGIGLRLLTMLHGGRMRDNCNGTDFSPELIRQAVLHGYSIFLLGGKAGEAEKAAQHLQQSIPGTKIAGTADGYFQDDEEIIDRINSSGAGVLLVAMGVPKQEKWIADHRCSLYPKMCLGVGALVDYLSNTIPRAPKWMRRVNLEWCWRIFVEPKRMFKRYIVDGVGFMLSALVYYLKVSAGKTPHPLP